MTQTSKQILRLKKLAWEVPQARGLREIEASCFGTAYIQGLVDDNYEADVWAYERYQYES